jgi:hypothetical protein
MLCSLWFPTVGGEALGVRGRQIMSHILRFAGYRRNAKCWYDELAALVGLSFTFRATPAPVGDRQVEIGI